jgi:hypothetical protein
MPEPARSILARMLTPGSGRPGLPIVDLSEWLPDPADLADPADPLAQRAAAFLVRVAGPDHPLYERAAETLEAAAPGPTADVADFWADGLERLQSEVDRVSAAGGPTAARLAAALDLLDASTSPEQIDEALWTAFFPQAVGIRGHEDARIAELRSARTVTITSPVMNPIRDPGREVLFTSNVLLTVPAEGTDLARLPYPQPLCEAIAQAAAEPQHHWFDHPIQIGVEPAANELLYGLRQLDAAIDAEEGAGRITCLLSVSVTHDGLAPIARQYVEAELAREGELRHIDLVVVTEDETRRLVEEVIVPALATRLGHEAARTAAAGLRDVVGVDGKYGRHYSFLKAVAALWHVAVDAVVRATFKIDLDQVFPQADLLAETGRTMFGHLTTPLWGATARDADGRELELGMLAGALVNERDVRRGLFTPDVPLPQRRPVLDEHVFFSALPQAISTRAEMMARYGGAELDGRDRALQRIHVTGGTNGIRVDALRRHRPFTPTFVGRAEDQAYLMSVLGRPGPRLGYAHAAGLIMRHDKEAFAGEAMAAARIGKLIGDDERILAFSAFADAAAGDGLDDSLDRAALGQLLDPFTGCFASSLPQTVTLLRVALRTLRLFADGDARGGREYAVESARRVHQAFEALADSAAVKRLVEAERAAWDHYHDALDLLEEGIRERSEVSLRLQARAREIIDTGRIRRGRVLKQT